MKLPVYTELSNFNTRKGGTKIRTDLSVALIVGQTSDPVDTINSIYEYLSKTKNRVELLLINVDREGYQYDRLLQTIPTMRALIPQEKITVGQAIFLAAQESLSKDVLFIDESLTLTSIDPDLLSAYLTQSDYGAILPVVTDELDEPVPNIVKANLAGGFIDTVAVDIRGAAIASLYPKYFCFVLNRDMLLSRDIELNDYDSKQYLLLELGYKIWRNGFLIFQAPSFKTKLHAVPSLDIAFDIENGDYVRFVYSNLQDKACSRARSRKIRGVLLKNFVTFRFKKAKRLAESLARAQEAASKAPEYPLDNAAVFATINKDFK